MTLTLRQRVLLTQLPLALLFVVLGFGGTTILDRLGSRIDAILRENYASVVAMQRLNESLERIDSSFQFALAGREAPARDQYRDNWQSYRDALQVEEGNVTVPGEQEAVEDLVVLTDRYQREGDAFYADAASRPKRYFEPSGLLDVFKEIKATSGLILRLNESNMEQASRDAKATAARSHTALAALLAATAIFAAFAAWSAVRATVAPIAAITKSALAVSAGDFDHSVPCASRDELGTLGHAFNQMVERLRVSRRTVEERTGQLERAEQKYRGIVHNAIVGIFQTTPGGRYIDVNPAMASMLGYASTGELMTVVQDIAHQLYADPARRTEFMRLLQENGSVSGFEAKYLRKDKTSIWVSVTARAVRDERGAVAFYEGFAVDVTARRRAEDGLRRLNRSYRALSSCNELLIRAEEEPSWLLQICHVIVEQAGYRMCWVGYAEHDDRKTVRPVAQAGFDEGYLEKIDVSWADTERGRGPTGTCIRTRSTTISRDIAADPKLAPWREEAMKRGYASSIALPLLVESEPIGALTIYSVEPDAFGDEEVSLLSELTGDLAYGITVLRTRAEHTRALEERAAHEREVETGLRIQKMLLLDEPPRDVPGLRIAALTIPSRAISGDFYAFLRHENHCLDLIVADVMGKGVPAALLSAAAKGHFPEAMWRLMSTSRPGELPQPRDLVTLAHAHMARELIELESFVTLCYARFDRRARRLDFVDCGHTGILHMEAKSGRCSIVHGENVPLGVIEGEIFDQISIPFDAGDVLLFFSDGVTEARDEQGEMFGPERLMECVRQNRGLDPAALVEAVRDAASGCSASAAPADDLTCVAVKIVEYELPIAAAETELASDLAELRRAREFIRGFCEEPSRQLLGADDLAALELAVDEAVSNVVKHAYGGRSDQRIHLGAEAFSDRVSIRIRHMGKPFDASAVEAPLLDGSRESGFGVYLIEKSVDRAHYGRDELGRNCIDLEKRRRGRIDDGSQG